jgi:hypothetical protein
MNFHSFLNFFFSKSVYCDSRVMGTNISPPCVSQLSGFDYIITGILLHYVTYINLYYIN